MTVQVLFFAQLREIFGETARSMRVPEGISIDGLVRALRAETRGSLPPLVYAVNEEFEDGDRRLLENDIVALMTPMSGG